VSVEREATRGSSGAQPLFSIRVYRRVYRLYRLLAL